MRVERQQGVRDWKVMMWYLCSPTKKGTGASRMSVMASGMIGMKAPCQTRGKRRASRASATGVSRA